METSGKGVCPYLADSLAGRWLKLARQWIADNGPCDVSSYFENVPQLMPTHIKPFREYSDPQISLAKAALKKLKSDGFIVCINGILRSVQKKGERACLYDHASVIGERRVIDLSELKEEKYRNALRQYLRSRKWKLVKKNTYQRPE